MTVTVPPFISSILAELSVLASPTAQQELSDALLDAFRVHLEKKTPTMLPSFVHRLPTGEESGTAVAIDLGGSTLRVALMELPSRECKARREWNIDNSVKQLHAVEFFDWVAERISEATKDAGIVPETGEIVVGLTWSFPIEQTSLWSGNVQTMGKGFTTYGDIVGTDLREHLHTGFRRKGLSNLIITALMNDTESVLLSHAYTHPATRVSLICGTGFNAALQLPIAALSSVKFETPRPESWTSVAKHILVNTECSMFGGGILPLSEADRELDEEADLPGFQPAEQLVSGQYLGEICRRIFIKAASKGELFSSHTGLPKELEQRFTFGSEVMAAFEEDLAPEEATRLFSRCAKLYKPLTPEDIAVITSICRAVASRAALVLAVMVFTLCRLRWEHGQQEDLTGVAYCGSVVEKHSTVKDQCQKVLDELCGGRKIVLEPAPDAALLGSAVGALMNLKEAREAGGK